MQITIEIPDALAPHLPSREAMSRELLEAYAADAYRMEKLSRHQVSELLGLDYWQTEDFLTARDAKRPYTLADLDVDRRSLATLPSK